MSVLSQNLTVLRRQIDDRPQRIGVYGREEKPVMADDPNEIADYLIEELSLERAIKTATEGAAEAQSREENYDLSVWREVRRVLRERKSSE